MPKRPEPVERVAYISFGRLGSERLEQMCLDLVDEFTATDARQVRCRPFKAFEIVRSERVERVHHAVFSMTSRKSTDREKRRHSAMNASSTASPSVVRV